MTRLLSFGLTLGILFPLMLAQAQDTGAIETLLEQLEDKSVPRYLTLYDLAVEYADHDNQKALEFLIESRKDAIGKADSAFLMKNLCVTGQILRRLGRFDEALALMDSILRDPGFTRHADRLPQVYQTIGLIHLYRSELDIALDRFLNGLELAEETKDTLATMSLTGNIAIVYYRLSNYKKAISFFERSHEMVAVGSQTSCSILTNLSLCYSNLDEIELAGFYIKRVLRDCLDMPLGVSMHVQYADGYYHFKRGDYAEAERRFLASLDTARELGDRRMEVDNLIMLTEIKVLNSDWASVRHYLRVSKALVESGVNYNKEVMKLYRMMGELYMGMKEYPEAAQWQRKYITLRDSIYDDARTSGLMKVEGDFMTRAARKRVALQDDLIRSKEEALKWERKLNILFSIVGLLAMALFGLGYRDWRRKRAMKESLSRLVEERTRELQTREAAAGTLLREREAFTTRFAQDIESVSQRIVGLCAIGQYEKELQSAKGYFEEIQRQAETIAGITRQLKDLGASS